MSLITLGTSESRAPRLPLRPHYGGTKMAHDTIHAPSWGSTPAQPSQVVGAPRLTAWPPSANSILAETCWTPWTIYGATRPLQSTILHYGASASQWRQPFLRLCGHMGDPGSILDDPIFAVVDVCAIPRIDDTNTYVTILALDSWSPEIVWHSPVQIWDEDQSPQFGRMKSANSRHDVRFAACNNIRMQ